MDTAGLAAEIRRQEKSLEDLPNDFTFPLFNAQQALESQRRSGYRDTGAAVRELVDNALEAGASRIDIAFDEGRSGKRPIVQNLAVIDDGSGMLAKMARYALSWGGGTHFDDHEFIGRFGFGLPNASINQTRRVEVYTRTGPDQEFTMAWLDVNEFQRHGIQEIAPPTTAQLPQFVQKYLDRHKLSVDHGTVVVWANPDRLTYKSPAHLQQHLIDDFGVVYRYLLRSPLKIDGIDLRINNKALEPVDPLFLQPGAWLYQPPEEGGAIEQDSWNVVLHQYLDPDTGEARWESIDDPADLESIPVGDVVGTVVLRLARFPLEFVDGEAKTGDAHRRFEIRKSRRGMSFVRAGREIQTIDVFPRSQNDRASGLGLWPLLQGYAYHWGIEAKFNPVLDEAFGITNDKQSVRPVEDFWRILSQKDIDAALRRENTWQSKQRKARRKARLESSLTPTHAEQSAQSADLALSERIQLPERSREQAEQDLTEEAEERVRNNQAKNLDEARGALEEEGKRRRYRIEFVDLPDGPFYEPTWLGRQMVIQVNRLHRFYGTFYEELVRLPGSSRAKDAVDLLLLTLGRGELLADDGLDIFYRGQRTRAWSPYLETALSFLDRVDPEPEDELDLDHDPNEEGDAATAA
jgi:hypothetical protein